MYYCLTIITVLLLSATGLNAQQALLQDSTITNLQQLPSKYLDKVSDKVKGIEEKLDKKSAKALQQLRKSENKIYQKLLKIDSFAARNLLSNAAERYKQLEQKLKFPGKLTQYLPGFDTLITSLKFFEQNPQMLSTIKDAKEKLNGVMAKVHGLENGLRKAEDIKQFLRERKQFLKDQLGKLAFTKELKKINKQVYYYSQQVNEYITILKDPKKIEKKVTELLSKTKLFKDFMRKHSMLASLFPMPGGSEPGQTSQVGFAGLQTRAQVTTFLQQSGMSGPNNSSLSQLQQNIQDVQSQISQLRNKLTEFTGGSGGDLDMPNFKPNTQKTKSFFKRLEYGTNIQSQKSRNLLPVATDIGLSIGYKLNDKSIIGIGTSYMIGWGQGWNNIKLTSEGIGLRSFVEWKIKKSWWISGGYEQNYRASFNRIEQLKEFGAWQRSGLLGMSKSVSLKSKLLKSTKVQLLWDFLSGQQKPKTQPIVFRIGYSFN